MIPKFTALFTGLFLLAFATLSEAKVLDIQNVATSTGIDVWLVEDHSVPVMTISFSFPGGISGDPLGKEGRARMVSIMLDEGAGDIPSQAFQKQLTDLSIDLSFTAGRDAFFGQMKTLTSNREQAFELLTLALTQPRFDSAPLERMKNANLSQIKNNKGKGNWLVARSFNGTVYGNHPYGRPGHGTETSTKSITSEDLHSFVTNNFSRNGLKISVAGDITAQELSSIIDRVFGQLPEHNKIQKLRQARLNNAGKVLLYPFDIPQTFISAGHRSISRKDPDWPAAQILNYVLGGGGFSSRLMEEIRVKKGLSYGVYTSLNDSDHAQIIQLNMSTKNVTAQEAIKLIKQEWRKMLDTGLTESELKDAKAYLTGSLLLQLTSTNRIAGALNGLMRDGRDIDYINNRNDMLNAVTLEKTVHAAKKLLHPDELTFVLVGKPEGLTPDITLNSLPGMKEDTDNNQTSPKSP